MLLAQLMIALFLVGMTGASHLEGLRWCVLHERGEWAVDRTADELFLSDKRYGAQPKDIRCRVHPASRIEVVGVGAGGQDPAQRGVYGH